MTVTLVKCELSSDSCVVAQHEKCRLTVSMKFSPTRQEQKDKRTNLTSPQGRRKDISKGGGVALNGFFNGFLHVCFNCSDHFPDTLYRKCIYFPFKMVGGPSPPHAPPPLFTYAPGPVST